LTLLLNKGQNEFADQYGFNLNFDNGISLPIAKGKGQGINFTTGISYVDGNGLPGYFGIFGGKGKKSMKIDAHELNQLENIWSERVTESDVMRMQTRVRCVKD
jgi:hypothetical protein